MEEKVLFWRKKAEETPQLEMYLKELEGLKQLVGIFESKNKVRVRQDQAAAYKALQREFAAVLEERKRDRPSSDSQPPSPLPNPDISSKTSEKLPETPPNPPETLPKEVNFPSKPSESAPIPANIPKSTPSFRVTSTLQTLSTLEQKFSKLQNDRNSLQQALLSIKDTDSVQERGKKHALEMELGMIDSTIAMLVEKIGRYRKSAENAK